MHNVFVNQTRSPRLVDYSGDEALPVLPTRPTQNDTLELRDLARILARLLEEQREVLLVVLEDLSYEDTAKVLGVPVGTIMSRLSRGHERLRPAIRRGTGRDATESRQMRASHPSANRNSTPTPTAGWKPRAARKWRSG
jgi:RNA polymerase sigma-70 factor (ECF subfamily)